MNKKIKVYAKTLYYILRLFFLILLVFAIAKHGNKQWECNLNHPNGSMEKTGLYGNCQYLQNYLDNYNMNLARDLRLKMYEEMYEEDVIMGFKDEGR